MECGRWAERGKEGRRGGGGGQVLLKMFRARRGTGPTTGPSGPLPTEASV